MNGPLLIFDGDCRFCRKSVARLQSWTTTSIPARSSQECGEEIPGATCADFQGAIQYIDQEGTRHAAARAVFECMAAHGISRWPLLAYQKIPLLARLFEWGYRWVASHRTTLSRIEFALSGPSLVPPTYQRSMGLFLRGMGLIYALGFFSLLPQIQGLIGTNGILPAADYLQSAAQYFGGPQPWKIPTLFWLDGSSPMLQAACWIGGITGLLALAGVAPLATLFISFVLYLSLVQVGGDFLAFQWDNLLLESGVLACLLALSSRWNFLRKALLPHYWLGRLLLWWLLFRLMFCSGVVKLASGDLAWSGLTALNHHFETQPLPTMAAWFFHHFPDWLHLASTVALFGTELLLPFAIWGPRRLKLVAAAGFLLLEMSIALTGNYGYFNLLTLLLVVTLIDDGTWSKIGLAPSSPSSPALVSIPRRILLPTAVWAAIVLLVSVPQVVRSFGVNFAPPGWRFLAGSVAPLRVINSYGLFAVMTRERREITLEGSHDGRSWQVYPFRWKPGNPGKAPAWVAPHMPRLDWQMWFAALGRARDNPWFIRLCYQLLRGSPEVAGLFADNPFPEHPPRFLRARIQTYTFSGWDTWRRDGTWWECGPSSPYLPVLTLENFKESPRP